MIFSFSRLNMYARCPYRFYRKYVLKEQEEPTLPLALGKAVHKAIECRIKGMDENEAVMEGIIESDFFPGVTFDDVAFLSGRAGVKPFIGETEVHFQLPLSKEPDAPIIQGFVDLVQNDGTAVTDWKTNRVMYDILDNYQLGLYAWAIGQIYNSPYIYGSLFFLRFKQASRHAFTPEDMEQARLWAYNLAREINTNLTVHDMMPDQATKIFPAKPSSDCKHCPFAFECMKEFSVV